MGQKTLSQKMAENLLYYTSNPKKRCVDGGVCKYHGETLGIKTKGCFVGALMSSEQRKWADKNLKEGASGIMSLKSKAQREGYTLPKIITENVTIMTSFQGLHDCNDYWTEEGLTPSGVSNLDSIIRRFAFNRNDFAECFPK